MSTTNIMLEAFMQLGSAKQEVYAKNVASANQPGYVTKDIASPDSFSKLIKSTSSSSQLYLVTTKEGHISGSKPVSKFRIKIDPDGGQLKPNGNNVDLAVQAKKAAENEILFDTAVKAYQNTNSLIKSALGKGR